MQKSRSCAERHMRVLGISLTSQASKMTVFRFQESGHFLHLADICPACRLRQSGNCAHICMLAGIWNRRGLSKCPDRCPACRDLIRTRNSATVYTDALLAGNGKQHLDIQMPSLLGFWTEAFCASVYPDALLASFGKHRIIGQSSAAARLTTAQPGRAFRIILPGLLFCKTE